MARLFTGFSVLLFVIWQIHTAWASPFFSVSDSALVAQYTVILLHHWHFYYIASCIRFSLYCCRAWMALVY